MYKNPEMRTDEHMVNYIKDFEPLVRATAFRYYGRGAEIDDLLQEGYLALVTLIPKCPDMDYLPGFLKERLPAYVRNAAARLRHRNGGEYGEVLLEDIEETVGEQESRHKFSEAELSELLRRGTGHFTAGRNQKAQKHPRKTEKSAGRAVNHRRSLPVRQPADGQALQSGILCKTPVICRLHPAYTFKFVKNMVLSYIVIVIFHCMYISFGGAVYVPGKSGFARKTSFQHYNSGAAFVCRNGGRRNMAADKSDGRGKCYLCYR